MISQNTASHSIDLAHQDCVIKSGIDLIAFIQNIEPASGSNFYDILFRDTDPTTNTSSGSAQAKRNYTKCEEAIGFIVNGRCRQLAGPPIAFSKSKNGKWEPRKYHQPYGKPLKIFFPTVSVGLWEAVAKKAALPMPAFFDLGLIDPQFAKFIFCNNPIVSAAILMCGVASKFWEWVKITNCPVILTEGEKKALSLISRGYAAIGLPGINTGYRVTERGDWVTKPDGTEYQRALARQLHEALQPLDTAERSITIIFDYRAGDYSNSQEFKAASTLGKLFKSAIAKIGKLPGPDKGVDDFLVAGGDIDAVVAEASQELSEDWKLKKWLRLRGFTPDRTINSKYFDAPAPESGTVTAIKSGLGTGKTEWVKSEVANDTHGLQLNLGCRNSLLLQQCEKWGSNHWDEHKGYLFTKDANGRLSLCVDSLLKLPIEMFENSVNHVRGMTVIFDESVSAIKHALTSSTLLGKRLEILERLGVICKLADRVILLDGNQSDIVVDYIAKISGKRSIKIQNDFTGDTPPIFFVDAGKKSKKWLSAEILKSPCPAVATDSLRDAEALELRLTESHGPGLLLTSKTGTEDWAKEFLKNPDVYIREHKPAWLIFSPTAESGIDISIPDYFSDVFCWFVGVLEVDECLQISRRVRHPERVVVLCPERGLRSNKGGGMFEAEIIKAFAEFGDTEARLLVDDESQLQKIKEDLAAQIVTPETILWAKLQAKAELERSNLREYLLKAFELGGYSVQQVSAADCHDDGHAVAKEECKDREAQEIFNAPDIDLSEALKIKQNYSAAWSERCQSIKALLKARLPGIEDSSLWNWKFIRRVRFDDRLLLSQLDADWIYNNPEDAEFLQRHRLSAGKREFLGDFSTRWLKIKALRTLGLEKFLESGKVWSQENPEVIELLELCKKKAIANLFGHPGKMKPIQWLNKLLALIGRKLIGKNVKQNGVQHRAYSFLPDASLPDDWDTLTAFTAEKQAKKISEIKEAQLLAVQELEEVAPPPFFDTNIGVDATPQIEDSPELPAVLVENSPELPEPEAPITQKTWAWFQRKLGEWIKCGVVEFTEGRYLLEAKSMVDAGVARFRAYPEDLRWEAPAS